jgi:hypothetical protein
MTRSTLLEKSKNIREYGSNQNCVSFTDLARGSSWRKRLPESGILQITDRGKSAGWIVSDAEMSKLETELEQLEAHNCQLEEALEALQIEAIFKTRKGGKPQTGANLKKSAKQVAAARGQELKALLNEQD